MIRDILYIREALNVFIGPINQYYNITFQLCTDKIHYHQLSYLPTWLSGLLLSSKNHIFARQNRQCIRKALESSESNKP